MSPVVAELYRLNTYMKIAQKKRLAMVTTEGTSQWWIEIMKTIYQVSFKVSYPRETEVCDDDVMTAFVLADSFNEAQRKVEQRYKKEFESAKIFGISLAEKVDIII